MFCMGLYDTCIYIYIYTRSNTVYIYIYIYILILIPNSNRPYRHWSSPISGFSFSRVFLNNWHVHLQLTISSENCSPRQWLTNKLSLYPGRDTKNLRFQRFFSSNSWEKMSCHLRPSCSLPRLTPCFCCLAVSGIRRRFQKASFLHQAETKPHGGDSKEFYKNWTWNLQPFSFLVSSLHYAIYCFKKNHDDIFGGLFQSFTSEPFHPKHQNPCRTPPAPPQSAEYLPGLRGSPQFSENAHEVIS